MRRGGSRPCAYYIGPAIQDVPNRPREPAVQLPRSATREGRVNAEDRSEEDGATLQRLKPTLSGLACFICTRAPWVGRWRGQPHHGESSTRAE